MKRILLLFVLLSSYSFGQNIWFTEPTSNHVDYIGQSGTGPIAYSSAHATYLYVYRFWARIKSPYGSWSAWQEGESGGWWVSKAGTYEIEGKASVESIFYPGTIYMVYRSPFSFSVVDSYAPSTPQTPSMSSNYGQYGNVRLDWSANTEADLSHYEVWRYIDEEAEWRGWEQIGTTANNYFIDTEVFYAPNAGNVHARYKIKAVDINNNYSNFSAEVTERVEPTWKRQPSNLDSHELFQKEIVEETPKEYSVSNYPNPFNPTTTINYQLPADGFVTIKVYDIVGKEISTLVNEHKVAGKYKINFDASSLPSGVYIYSISTRGYAQTKKMILTK
ncbi:MAG: 5'-nucleotidase [Ignavibacteria bacterium]|nr:MAG: 5'-nucleotidase [Ignavibacteria bacterium]KAF0154786.1 MAG: 5'-nucleotidase [Ignavibacteria bacterium]